MIPSSHQPHVVRWCRTELPSDRSSDDRVRGPVGEIGNKIVRRHGSQSPVSLKSTIGILDAHGSCQQPAEFERADGDMPDAIVNVLEADIFASAGV